jgi:hypothetical protein
METARTEGKKLDHEAHKGQARVEMKKLKGIAEYRGNHEIVRDREAIIRCA